MLVLSRRVGERVVMSDGVVLKVIEIRGHALRLGIEAPASVTVWRGELLRPSAAGPATTVRPDRLPPGFFN
jgi:carbon storage regulator